MGELGALFNPGMRHELEERRARAARREEEGNARDGDLRIDLESGVAVINTPGSDSPATEDDTSTPGPAVSDTAASDTGAAVVSDSSGTDSADPGTREPAEAATDAESKPAPLRPRGKRAMSATRR